MKTGTDQSLLKSQLRFDVDGPSKTRGYDSDKYGQRMEYGSCISYNIFVNIWRSSLSMFCVINNFCY